VRHTDLRDPGQAAAVRTAALVGERWTLLILRAVFRGQRRFDEMQGELGVARNVLTARLKDLVAAGLLRAEPYGPRHDRVQYLLTEAGLDLWPALVALVQWGEQHLDPPQHVAFVHEACGTDARPVLTCRTCGDAVTARDIAR